jgi:hypothetical protein
MSTANDATRAELDRQMRGVLAQLATVSHVSAAGYQPSGRSGATSSRDLSGGDLGADVFARRYGPPFHEPTKRWPGAQDNDHRAVVLRAARDELDHVRGRGSAVTRPTGETAADRDHRIVHGYVDHRTGIRENFEGWPPEDVAMNTGTTAARVRKIRLRAGRDPENGTELAVAAELPAAERRRRARELAAAGSTLTQISHQLGASRSTIERDLGKRAAA